MKRGISVQGSYDRNGEPILRIAKKRGKLTLGEIEDILRYENGQQRCGYYLIILNCTEATIGANGLFEEEDPPGDSVDLYRIEEGDACPVCRQLTPLHEHCPNCGTAWEIPGPG